MQGPFWEYYPTLAEIGVYGQGCQIIYTFVPKIPILPFFGRPCNGKFWYDNWHGMGRLSKISPFLVCCTRTNEATAYGE
jgi:hypothetical protein